MPAIPKYLTVADFIERLGAQEADDLAGTGLRDARELDLDLIAAHLVHADGVIDGYVRARYPADFVAVPEILVGIAHDIARWRLRAKGGQQTAMAETVKAQYDAAMALLRDISAGRVTLVASGEGARPEPGAHADSMGGHMPASRMGRALEGW